MLVISKELDKYIYFGFVIIANVLTNVNIFKQTGAVAVKKIQKKAE